MMMADGLDGTLKMILGKARLSVRPDPGTGDSLSVG